MPRYARDAAPEYTTRVPLRELPPRIATVGRFGDRTATVGSGGALFSLPIWIFKVYDVDWRATEHPGGMLVVRPRARLSSCQGRSVSGPEPSARFIRECEERARAIGLPFVPGIRHNAPLGRAYIEQLEKNFRLREHRRAAAVPHKMCERAGRCVEHELHPDVHPCRDDRE